MYFFILISPLIGVDYKEIIAFILRLYKRDVTLVKPLTIYFWNKRARTTGGRLANTPAVLIIT